MGKILYVDLTSGVVSRQSSMAYLPRYIGGRSLSSRLAWEQIPIGVDAFDKDNCIIIMTGPLTGTLAPTSGRTIMSGVSPRTYPNDWYTHSTIGGWFGSELKYAGFDGMVITGKANSPVWLNITNDDVQIINAGDLWGKDARQTQLTLKKRLGQRTQLLCIGPAGENLVRFATVQHSEENAAGHSGFGAVWGSKNLKAVAVVGSQSVSIAYPEKLLKEVTDFGSRRKSPSIAILFEDNGTKNKTSNVDHRPVCSQACTFDCRVNTYAETDTGRRIPAACIGNMWRGSTPTKTQVGLTPMQRLEYIACGFRVPPATNFTMSQEVHLHELCNSLGLDLWFRLIMQPWFVRCRELRINKIRGYPIKPHNVSWFENFMLSLAYREGLGDIFAVGLRRAMDELEGELPEELTVLGRALEFNFGFPGHREGRIWDSEPLPFWLISAIMHIGESRDPTIGTHQSCLLHAEYFLDDAEASRKKFSLISDKVFGFPDAYEPTFENKTPVAIWSQDQHMLIDSLPMCDFAFPQLVRSMDSRSEWETATDILGDIDLDRRLLIAVTGVEITPQEMKLAAERAFNIERVLIARGGRGRAMERMLAQHFKLPCASDATCTSEQEFYCLMDEYYSARGWDLEFGWPLADTLNALGLQELVPEIKNNKLRENQ
ncbi:aldehyde ferredoxin oxidoreductase N-terminal domain-containing protein [Chloroflexota bacterium]